MSWYPLGICIQTFNLTETLMSLTTFVFMFTLGGGAISWRSVK